jgi:colicin import membrane protein
LVYTIRQYGLPLVLALALHVALGFWLRGGWQQTDPFERMIQPKIVNSTLLVLEPKPKPAPPKPQPKPQVAAPKPEPKPAPPDPAPVREQPPEPTQAELDRRAAAERARREEAERQARLRELAEASFIDALDEESVELAEAAEADAEAVAQSYRYLIYQKVVANWSRPPSARNGMQARLQVDLVPTGEVVAVTLIEGSGNTAFDQSAEQAVRKAGRFEVPEDISIFEDNFRRFTLLFRPEDLLR